MSDTHVVTNQVPPLENYNPATSPMLAEALIREGGQWGVDEVFELGALGRQPPAPSAGASWPIATGRSCTPTTATATGSTRSNTTPPTTS